MTTITGLIADINTAYASSGIAGLGNEQIKLTDRTISANDLITLDTNTIGSIDTSEDVYNAIVAEQNITFQGYLM